MDRNYENVQKEIVKVFSNVLSSRACDEEAQIFLEKISQFITEWSIKSMIFLSVHLFYLTLEK